MISWLLGSQPSPWSFLEDLFQDYRNVAIYVDNNNIVQIVKVSDIDEFYTPFSVLIHAKYFKNYSPYYIKLEKMVAFPTTNEKVADSLLIKEGWRGIKYYYGDEFLGAWILYDCIKCRDKQRSHLEISKLSISEDETIKAHLRIYNS
ncbi:hypothetical protein SULI_05105 [Saccharolobus solfataricus]|uniref:Uncharacterized protein n=3 Tax=Saccharolobus solfataricus TaxID=2287 RepID=Q981C3_SACS2|nr:hypothetical protein [Saccharolobus solfataricus]AAK40389.1 Hypothetical protein SSO0022 [Saccharolobus solfataricus P2]AKA73382.1 hypothetical protein SULB_1041 [Saccharolobus solfataricus]AKA76081.1 hypothetical protein SULC_1040 [Saccharolobus solfataricus]AKA78774.1 hypothetical protein SULA_1039 [Saccharolobus solfataricus]AZF67850.1 hypothetical protein SULG_05105 [Saccharolobus solfataricus]